MNEILGYRIYIKYVITNMLMDDWHITQIIII